MRLTFLRKLFSLIALVSASSYIAVGAIAVPFDACARNKNAFCPEQTISKCKIQTAYPDSIEIQSNGCSQSENVQRTGSVQVYVALSHTTNYPEKSAVAYLPFTFTAYQQFVNKYIHTINYLQTLK